MTDRKHCNCQGCRMVGCSNGMRYFLGASDNHVLGECGCKGHTKVS